MTLQWATRDGTKIPIAEMTNTHLRNAIHYMEKFAEDQLGHEIAGGYVAMSMLQGEMSLYNCAIAIAELEELDTYEYLMTDRMYVSLLKEAKRRGMADGEKLYD